MASSRSSEASEAVRREELSEIVRECVRSEMALQRSGNTSLLTRTRDLIANSARSASREATNSIVAPSFPATSSPLLSSSAGPSETRFHTGQSSSFQAGSKRPAASTSQHPWRFKKGKQKKTEVSFHPKAVHLLDKPAEQDSDGHIPDYTITEDMILLKGFFELGTGQSEREIRDIITEVLKQRFPFIRADHFDFVKRERNKVTTPIVQKTMEWHYKHIRELCGQGKLYVRLNVPRECIEAYATDDEGEDELMTSPFISESTCSRLGNTSSEHGLSYRSPSITDDVSVSVGSTSSVHSTAGASSSGSSGCQSDKEALRQLVPSASEEELDNALLQCGSLNSAANTLLKEETNSAADKSLVEIISLLGRKLTGKKKKLDVDEDDLLQDAVAYYKSIHFDASCPLRVAYKEQPAVDSGGVLRQFYSHLFEGIVEGKLMVLFEGEPARKVPSYHPQAVMTGMLEMVGKMIAHSLAQGGPGFPCLALPCFYYLVSGDAMCAFAYCDVWDIPDPLSRNLMLQLIDLTSNETIQQFANTAEVVDLLSRCGESTVLQVSTKGKIVQSVVMHEVISKRKMALDQFRKGLATLGVIDEMSKHPDLFEKVFTFKPAELTPASVQDYLKYPDELSDQEQGVKMMMTRFVDQSPSARLMQLMQFCTGSKMVPSIQDFSIKINFHNESYISSSTCTFTMLLPNCFTRMVYLKLH